MSLYPGAKLIGTLFKPETLELRPTRDGYGEGLVAAGEKNKNVVALCADLTESTRTDAFAQKFPARFFECGVAEQNMATVAAGLAISGKIPFISSYATFSPGRNWEQIRTTIAYNGANVKIAGHHAGLSVGPDGATHQMTEDIALMRAMPNMRVIVPCDAVEARKATEAVAAVMGPCYLRFTREKSPVFTTASSPFIPGKAQVMWESHKPRVVVFACGPIVHEALKAVLLLEREGIASVVVNVHTISPLDEKKVADVAKKCGAVVTAEEHQVAGGLGGAVAECLSRMCPTPIEFVGLHGVFGQSGTPAELAAHYGLDAVSIADAARRAIARAER